MTRTVVTSPPAPPTGQDQPARRYVLGSGLLGDALATLVTGKATGEQTLIERARLLLREAGAVAGRQRELGRGLFTGADGFGWVLACFRELDCELGPGYGAALAAMTDQLTADEPAPLPPGAPVRCWDLISGYAGQLACLLRLRRAARGARLRAVEERAGQFAQRLVRRPGPGRGLDVMYVATDPWRAPAWYRGMYPDGHYPLGMAHGAAGVVGVLAAAIADGLADREIVDFVDHCLDDLMGVACPRPAGATWHAAASAAPKTGRPVVSIKHTVPSAWCKGTAGVAASLAAGGAVTGRGDVSRHAVAAVVADASGWRGRKDTGLCHGMSGLAVISGWVAGFADPPERTYLLRVQAELLRDIKATAASREPGLLCGTHGEALALLGDRGDGWSRLLGLA